MKGHFLLIFFFFFEVEGGTEEGKLNHPSNVLGDSFNHFQNAIRKKVSLKFKYIPSLEVSGIKVIRIFLKSN